MVRRFNKFGCIPVGPEEVQGVSAVLALRQGGGGGGGGLPPLARAALQPRSSALAPLTSVPDALQAGRAPFALAAFVFYSPPASALLDQTRRLL